MVSLKSAMKGLRCSLVKYIDDTLGWSIGEYGKFGSGRFSADELVSEAKGNKIVSSYQAAGLNIDVVYEKIKSVDAIRISGVITNKANSPKRVNKVRSLAFRLGNFASGTRIWVYTMTGGIGDWVFPPTSFSIAERELIATARSGSLIQFDSGMGSGYSSNKEMPFALVQIGEEGGIFCAMEWPGAWWGCVNRWVDSGKDNLWIELGPVADNLSWAQQDEWDILLEPNESIPLPAAIVGLYEGDYIEGANALRNLIYSMRPTVNGAQPDNPVNLNCWFMKNFLATDYAEVVKQIDVCSAMNLGIEYFVFDAGWYAGSEMTGNNFMVGTGNWREENKKKFPDGLKALAEYIHNKGMKFGLWIAPENCHKDSQLAKEHPDWVIPADPSMPSMVGHDNCLVDFGKHQVVEWFKETIDIIVERFDIDWLKWDFNIYPEPFWKKTDKPNRRGISQIRHIQGILELWNYILAKYPHLIIEGCCGGGRRMDLASLKRSHTYWSNDETSRPALQLYENTCGNFFLPASFFNRMIRYDDERKPYPEWYYFAIMGGTFAVGERTANWKQSDLEELKRHIAVYKKIRHLLNRNYRSIFGVPRSRDEWIGWQFHNPQADEGVVFFFRDMSKTEQIDAKLKWLERDKNYEFTDPYTEQPIFTFTGAKALDTGLPIRLPFEGASILRYKGVDSA